jgi:hypothetical protein
LLLVILIVAFLYGGSYLFCKHSKEVLTSEGVRIALDLLELSLLIRSRCDGEAEGVLASFDGGGADLSPDGASDVGGALSFGLLARTGHDAFAVGADAMVSGLDGGCPWAELLESVLGDSRGGRQFAEP